MKEHLTPPEKFGRVFRILVALVVFVWVGMGFLVSRTEDPGKFGDMFGAVNALFSGLAFAGLIGTLLLQRRELSLQRTELQLQRKELVATRAEMAAQTLQFQSQNETLTQQTFDNTFFQLLRAHSEIVSEITLDTGGPLKIGRHCFEVFYSNLKHHLEQKHRGEGIELIKSAYSNFYGNYQAYVGHYFRSIYNLMKFVHGSEAMERRRYTNLVRAQLSSFELLIVFYNCLSPLGDKKFKPLIEEYGLLKHVPFELLTDEQHKLFYAAKAFA